MKELQHANAECGDVEAGIYLSCNAFFSKEKRVIEK